MAYIPTTPRSKELYLSILNMLNLRS